MSIRTDKVMKVGSGMGLMYLLEARGLLPLCSLPCARHSEKWGQKQARARPGYGPHPGHPILQPLCSIFTVYDILF